MASLISFDENGEPWFDNPNLILANPRRRRRYRSNAEGFLESLSTGRSHRIAPFSEGGRTVSDPYFGYRKQSRKKKGRKRMARGRNRKGQFIKGHRRSSRRRSYGRRRRRLTGSVARRFASGFRRRRRYTGTLVARGRGGRRRRGRVRFRINRRYRHNPLGMGSIHLPFGLVIPPLDLMGAGVAGFVACPYISAQIQTYVAQSGSTILTGNTWAPYLIDVVSILVPGMLLRKFAPKYAMSFMVGGGIAFLVKVIKQQWPQFATQYGVGTMGWQGNLGAYFDRTATVRQFPVRRQTTPLPAMIGNAPDRLNPAGRF